MALIACKECDKQISDTAPACPHCGYKTPTIEAVATPKENSMGCGMVIVYVLLFFSVIFLIIVGLGSMGNSNPSGPPGVSNTNIGSYGKDSQQTILLEQRDKFAESCKNGHASDCINEKNLTDLLNAGSITTSP